MMEAVSTSETSVNFYNVHGTPFHKTSLATGNLKSHLEVMILVLVRATFVRKCPGTTDGFNNHLICPKSVNSFSHRIYDCALY
jgi:hypothetical protein